MRSLWATTVLASSRWDGITLASVRMAKEVRTLNQHHRCVPLQLIKPVCHSATGLAQQRNSTLYQWTPQIIATFPFFYSISPHPHFLNTSSQMKVNKNSLNRKHQTASEPTHCKKQQLWRLHTQHILRS